MGTEQKRATRAESTSRAERRYRLRRSLVGFRPRSLSYVAVATNVRQERNGSTNGEAIHWSANGGALDDTDERTSSMKRGPNSEPPRSPVAVKIPSHRNVPASQSIGASVTDPSLDG